MPSPYCFRFASPGNLHYSGSFFLIFIADDIYNFKAKERHKW